VPELPALAIDPLVALACVSFLNGDEGLQISAAIAEKTTMSIPMARKRLADQIRAAIQTDNDRSPNNIEELDLLAEQWRATPEAREDRLLDNAYHFFLHFLTDRDIRSRNPQYAETQICEMRQLIEKLGSGSV